MQSPSSSRLSWTKKPQQENPKPEKCHRIQYLMKSSIWIEAKPSMKDEEEDLVIF